MTLNVDFNYFSKYYGNGAEKDIAMQRLEKNIQQPPQSNIVPRFAKPFISEMVTLKPKGKARYRRQIDQIDI